MEKIEQSPTHDIVDELKGRVEEILTQLNEGTIDSETAWKEIRVELVNAYDFGSEKFEEETGNLMDGVSTEEALDELEGRSMDSGDICRLKNIVLREGKSPFFAENLYDEQKLELLEMAMKKYSLQELENRLKW